MKNGSSVSKEQLDLAVINTQDELYHAGFWNEGSRLLQTEIFWCKFPQITNPEALGFFTHGTNAFDSLIGVESGHIYIPKWVLFHGPWQNRGSLRDVVRHEYGHAVAHWYPKLIQQGPRFRDVFGGDYWSEDEFEYDPEFFVSEYAATKPMDDYAETFMIYLRSSGKLPERFATPSIKKKWKFIRDLGRVVSAGGCSW